MLSDLSDEQRSKLLQYYLGLLSPDEEYEIARLLLRPAVCRTYGDIEDAEAFVAEAALTGTGDPTGLDGLFSDEVPA